VDSTSEVLERTARAVATGVEAVFADLEELVCAVQAAAADIPAKPGRSHFAFLKERFLTLIKTHSKVIEGAGIAYAPGGLSGVELWLEWWRDQPGAKPRFKMHDLSPNSIRYYDYSGRDWFRIPVSTGLPIAVGPYVDMGGGDVNTITLTAPAPTRYGTHVIGCDVSLSGVEEIFLRALGIRRPTVVLVGPNGRVITSNSARLVAGTLMNENVKIIASRPVSDLDPGRLPWKVLALDEFP
jgi:hypothetical protein